MPRGSKKNANQHNSRHENGIVAPGKRVVKQRSNPTLNGSPDGRPTASSPPPATATPLPASNALSPTSSSLPLKNRANGSVSSAAAAASHAARVNNGLVRGQKEEQTADELYAQQDSGADSNEAMVAESHAMKRPEHAAASSRSYGAVVASLPVPLTVLLSCPLRDALAILILLLSLPPVLVTVTNSLFAVMTFVPPSGSFTLVPTLTDITSSFSPGTPSFLVTCLIDILAMTLWIWIPFPSLQAFFLDAAQAMVATTLGGGYSYRPGSKDNTLYCVTVVVATHIARYRAIFLRPIRHRIEKWGPWIGEFDHRYIEKYPVGFDRNWLATIKVFIALHIFCQGVTGMVRRRLHTPRPSVTASSSRPTDTESAHAYTSGVDVPPNPPHSPTELRPRQSFPNLREANRDKISSGKRRRKQANFVRSQQPFWAAIAATKTNIMREYETNRATADAANSKATGPNDLGDAPFLEAENVVWVTEVKETTLYFETGPLPTPRSYRDCDETENETSKDEGVDRSKPLYVRCNKTNWVSTRLVPIPDSGFDYRSRWVGEVYGLSAGKTYSISFVRSEDDEVISTETLATPAATLDVTASTPSIATFSPARPSSPASPTATLKSSIADSESRVADLEAHQRRARKENKAAISNLHRDIEVFNERSQNNSSNDDSLQTRLGQLTQHKRQVDDAVDSINAELDNFETLPPEELKEWKSRKGSVDAARKKQALAHNDLANVRKTNKQTLDSRKSEELNISHKIVRLQNRLKRVSEQHDKLATLPEDSLPSTLLEQGRSNSDASGKDVAQSSRTKFHAARYATEIEALMRELQTRTMQNNNLQTQIKMLDQSVKLAQEHAFNSALGDDDGGYGGMGYYGASPLSAQHDGDGSRPITPDNEYTSAFAMPGGIGTGFGGARFEHSATPESTTAGLPGAFPLPEPNGAGLHSHFPHQSPPVHFHDARLHTNGSRLRSTSGMSGMSGESTSFQFFHPDDDELVPDKVKQHRRSGYGAASFGSGRDGGSFRDGGASEGSGSSEGASPAFKFRGMGIRGSPSPRT